MHASSNRQAMKQRHMRYGSSKPPTLGLGYICRLFWIDVSVVLVIGTASGQ
jgi:hypothetical protein